jgi:LacI family transcriptional regulator
MSDPIKAGATLKEVAQEAGVSIAAVSKVLHGNGKSIRVSEARAAEIREVASRLRYRPNGLARSLRTNRTHTVGLVWENMADIGEGPLYYVHLLDGVASELFKNHYRLTILPEIPRDSTISFLSDGRLDGLIWCKLPNDVSVAEELNHSPLQIVGLNAQATDRHLCPTVTCDNEGGADLVVEHLSNLGHRHMAIAIDRGSIQTPDAVARRQGFEEALKRRGLPFSESCVVYWHDPAAEFSDWWSQNPEVTAIFAWHEGYAARIMDAAHRARVAVPGDLSVVGFDSTMFCDTITPKLTAVRQPIREMAQMAARVLLNQIEGSPLGQRSYTFPCTLDVRESTSSPTRVRVTDQPQS